MQALARIRALWTVLRSRPDPDTEAGRALERQRRIALTGLASLLAKVISIGSVLISIPLTLGYLGGERYGVWVTISSFAALLSFSDLGVGNGVLNSVASALGRGDKAGIRTFITSGYLTLFGISVVLFAALLTVAAFVDLAALLNVRGPIAVAETTPAFIAFGCCFAASVTTGLIQRIQAGLQQGFRSSLWQCAASILTLLALLAAIAAQATLPVLVLSLVGTPVLVQLANSAQFFIRNRELAPRLSDASASASWQIFRTGSLFLGLQIVVALAYGSDNLILASTASAEAVATFAITMQIFGLASQMVAMGVAPIWPAYAEAKSRGDLAWIRRTLRSSVIFAFVLSSGLVVMLLLGAPVVFMWWLPEQAAPSIWLLVAVALWRVVEATGGAVAMYLNGMHIVKPQLMIAVVSGGVMIALKYALATQFGAAGIPFAAFASYLILTCVPYYFLTRSRNA